MKQYCLALDLKDDPTLIAEYKRHHAAVWPEILESIQTAGIKTMEIYLTGNRLFMIMRVNDEFSFSRKSIADAANSRLQQWENLMWNYQQALPQAKPGEKWILMEKIFSLGG